MPNRLRLRSLLPLTAIGLAIFLGGCVAYPAYPTYGYNAPYYGGSPYYGGPYVGIGVGGGWHEGGRHDRGWHDEGWRR